MVRFRHIIKALNRNFSKNIKDIISIKETKEGYEHNQFYDSKIVTFKAGNGGNGAVAMLREFKNPFGGPCGGNGGNGGHIILKGCSDTSDLKSIDSIIYGKPGNNGLGKSLDGANGDHVVIKVPVGTLILNDKTYEFIFEIKEDKETYIAARGGAGGKGNKFFATEYHNLPTIAEYGGNGEIKKLLLEVRLLADIGLVGIPNAGKSTLLRSLTRARPKVASYAFTTLRPHVGCIKFKNIDFSPLTICDIPGIVEDAHLNRGLGLEFLRHIERCRVLAFIIDLSRDSIDQYSVLVDEIRHYRPILIDSTSRLIVCNKLDLPGTRSEFDKFIQFLNKTHDPARFHVIPISALDSINMNKLIEMMRTMRDESVKFITK